jgi:hypothetical protein
MQSFELSDYGIAAPLEPKKSPSNPEYAALHHEKIIANCPKPGHSGCHGLTNEFFWLPAWLAAFTPKSFRRLL